MLEKIGELVASRNNHPGTNTRESLKKSRNRINLDDSLTTFNES